MFKTKFSNVKNNIITSIYQNDSEKEIQIIDIVLTNLRKLNSIFFDLWIEDEKGERFYLNYNSYLTNYDSNNDILNNPYKHPIKLISLRPKQRIRIKSYDDIANSSSSTPSDWDDTSIEDWSDGQPWSNLPENDFQWNEGTINDWITGFEHWFENTFEAPLTNHLNLTALLTLNIE